MRHSSISLTKCFLYITVYSSYGYMCLPNFSLQIEITEGLEIVTLVIESGPWTHHVIAKADFRGALPRGMKEVQKKRIQQGRIKIEGVQVSLPNMIHTSTVPFTPYILAPVYVAARTKQIEAIPTVLH